MNAFRKELFVVFLAHRFIHTRSVDVQGNLEAMYWVKESMRMPDTWNPLTKLWFRYVHWRVVQIIEAYKTLAAIGVVHVGEIQGLEVDDVTSVIPQTMDGIQYPGDET